MEDSKKWKIQVKLEKFTFSRNSCLQALAFSVLLFRLEEDQFKIYPIQTTATALEYKLCKLDDLANSPLKQAWNHLIKLYKAYQNYSTDEGNLKSLHQRDEGPKILHCKVQKTNSE